MSHKTNRTALAVFGQHKKIKPSYWIPAPPTQGRRGGSPAEEAVGTLLLPGDADAPWFRAGEGTGQQAEESELQHLRCCVYRAAVIPKGAPGRAQSSRNRTLVCGSRTCFRAGKKNTQCWSLARGNICSYDLGGIRTTSCLFERHTCWASSLGTEWGAEITHYLFNLEWTLISVFSLFILWPHIRGVIVTTPMENAMNEVAPLQEKKSISVLRWSLFLGGERGQKLLFSWCKCLGNIT